MPTRGDEEEETEEDDEADALERLTPEPYNPPRPTTNNDAMQALQQKCRPKHQVLVLKCYPRTSKGAVDVKPNSSELSYLLFYATSRKTKIQKVGSFLEKKTASDVWRQRIGYVLAQGKRENPNYPSSGADTVALAVMSKSPYRSSRP